MVGSLKEFCSISGNLESLADELSLGSLLAQLR